MTVIAHIAIDAEDFDIGQVLVSTTTPIQLTQFVPVDGQLVPYFWKERDGERERFERAVEADERVEALANLDGRVDSHLYRIDWADDINGLVKALHDHDILVEEGGTTDGERWTFHLRAASQEELSAFQRTCYDHDIRLDIRQLKQNPDIADAKYGMTGDQREALLLALKHGYFNVPRGISQSDLAEKLGISPQSFSRRLKRAERNVFETLFWTDIEEE